MPRNFGYCLEGFVSNKGKGFKNEVGEELGFLG